MTLPPSLSLFLIRDLCSDICFSCGCCPECLSLIMIITLQYYIPPHRTTPHHTTPLPPTPSPPHITPPTCTAGLRRETCQHCRGDQILPALPCAGQTEIKRDSVTVKVAVKSGSAYNIPIWLEPNLPHLRCLCPSQSLPAYNTRTPD